MSSGAPHLPPSGRVRPRVLVLLLLLLLALPVPGAHATLQTAPAAAACGSGETVEYDVLDTALRPPGRTAVRPAEALRPAPVPDPAAGAGRGPLPTPHRAYAPHAAARSMVLRC
ncbi:hypothetical protein [Streptomyces sp. NPDC002265]|uniref:hypothetical protein n=1 Tax=Streptomyces sp. NPDC002265 TaxID=3154415 RepID=UPI00331F017F